MTKPKKRKDHGYIRDGADGTLCECEECEPPKRSKSDEAFYKTCQATQDGTLLKEIDNKMKRSKELELLVKGFYLGAYCDGGQGVDVRHDYIEKAITAIEKWAKERYAQKNR